MFAFFLTQGLTGCSQISYYSQAIGGQWEIYRRAQPIDKILAAQETSTSLRHALSEAVKMRAFAHTELKLPNNRSYTNYVDLQRNAVVWSVFATPQFSLQPKQWCVPFLGCMAYRGYFARSDAQNLADALKAENYDVYVAGVTAYSTLGWFSDPILNTMLQASLSDLAGTMFHELAHQQLYLAGDTVFNESFAVAVEELGVARWLQKYGTTEELKQYQHAKQRHEQFIQLVLTIRNELQQIYQAHIDPQELAQLKQRTFEKLRHNYANLKQTWQGYSGYDRWFAADLNNAKLSSVVTYQHFVPAFHALFQQQHQDFEQFYQAVAEISQLPITERHQKLQAFVAQHN